MKELFVVDVDNGGSMWIPDGSDIYGDLIENYIEAENEDAVFKYLVDYFIKGSSEVDWGEDGMPDYKVDYAKKRIDWCEDEYQYHYIFEIEPVFEADENIPITTID
jgi:hypothetical protein